MQKNSSLRAFCSILIILIVFFSLAIELGFNLKRGDFVVDQNNIGDYYREYQKKMIEDKIDEYIYEDDDDENEEYEDDYEDFLKMKEKFADALNLAPSKIEHDDEWRKTDKIMKDRVKFMKRTCSVRRKIQNLVDQEDFDGLLGRVAISA
jgi:hypothetical protein